MPPVVDLTRDESVTPTREKKNELIGAIVYAVAGINAAPFVDTDGTTRVAIPARWSSTTVRHKIARVVKACRWVESFDDEFFDYILEAKVTSREFDPEGCQEKLEIFYSEYDSILEISRWL